jgi:hypothetical protein
MPYLFHSTLVTLNFTLANRPLTRGCYTRRALVGLVIISTGWNMQLLIQEPVTPHFH